MEALGHSNDEQAIKNRTLVSVEGGSLHALNGFVTDRMKFAGLLGHHAVHDGPSMHSRRYPQARAVQLWSDGPIEQTNRQTPIELPEVGDAFRLLENDPRVVGGRGAGRLALVQHPGV